MMSFKGLIFLCGISVCFLSLLLPEKAEAFEVCYTTPSENVDGTALTDLTLITVYWETVINEETITGNVEFPESRIGFYRCEDIVVPQNGTYLASATATNSLGEESLHSVWIRKEEDRTNPPLPPRVVRQPQPVFTVVKQPNRFVLLPIGTVEAGAQCDPNNTVNGYGAVPTDQVLWTGTARPVVVVTQCDG